jgi:hypothetical protein
MSFFLQTLSEIFKAFVLFVKGDEAANEQIHISEAHWLLSWLMVIASLLIYSAYLPSAFMSDLTQEILPENTRYSDFRSANLLSFVFVFVTGYLIVYLLTKPLEYEGSVRRYIIAQNWILLISILFTLPISLSIASGESPFVSLFIFSFLFLLFFAYRSIKITLGINGVKAFMILLILVVFELTADGMIDDWYGLKQEVVSNNPPS